MDVQFLEPARRSFWKLSTTILTFINNRTLLFISRIAIPCRKILQLAFVGAASSRDVAPRS